MAPNPQNNRLLARLAAKDFDAIRPHLEALDLPLRFEMEKPSRPIEHVYFPESGIASVVAIQPKDTHVEVGLIGREGCAVRKSSTVISSGNCPEFQNSIRRSQ